MNLNSTVRLTSDGTVRRVDLTYDVQATDIVQVYFNDDEIFTGWTLQRNTTPQRVDFDEYIPAGTLVLIRRYTDMREIPHLFHFTGNARGGAEFNAKNLDDNFDKIKRAAQDAMDSFELIGINLEAAANARDSADAAAASAALANTRANTASNQAQLATTKAQEATTEANKARTAANEAEAAKSHVAANALAAQNAEALAEQHRDDALDALSAAIAAKTAAAGSASAAAASANTASTQAQTATAQANAASASATLASNKADEVVSFANSAGNSAAQAAQSALEGAGYRDKAQQWAEHPVDTPVEANKFSSKHWASKAEQLVVDVAKTFTEDTVEVSFTGDGTATNKLKANIGLLDWGKLRSVPTVFPTDWDNLSGKPSVYPSAWANVANKPSTYPTTWAQVASKPALALANHTHEWDDIESKPTNYPTTWSIVAGKPSTYAPTIGSTSTTAKAGNWYPSWAEVNDKPFVIEIPPSANNMVVNDTSDAVATPTGVMTRTSTRGIKAVNGFLRVSFQAPIHLWALLDTNRAFDIAVQYRAGTAGTWRTTPARNVAVWAISDLASKPMSGNTIITGLNSTTTYYVRLVFTPIEYNVQYTVTGYQLLVSAI